MTNDASALVVTHKISYNHPMQKYKVFNHTADIGCEIFGKTRKELFANSVTALFGLILERSDDHRQKSTMTIKDHPEEKEIIIAGNDLEDLLINFLREVLYLFNGQRWVITSCDPLEINRNHCVARLSGEPYNLKKHKVTMEIKAVTYHGLSIQKTRKGWKARVIFDV
ncbi:MAG: archease [Smithellaceae bacterium]